MIEMLAAVLMMGLVMSAVTQVSALRNTEQVSIDAQYRVLSADAWLADIYNDFHVALSYDFTESPAGQLMLTFVKSDGSSSIYSFEPTEGKCYKNGVEQFDAQRLDVLVAADNLVVSLKLEDERLLEMNIYR